MKLMWGLFKILIFVVKNCFKLSFKENNAHAHISFCFFSKGNDLNNIGSFCTWK